MGSQSGDAYSGARGEAAHAAHGAEEERHRPRAPPPHRRIADMREYTRFNPSDSDGEERDDDPLLGAVCSSRPRRTLPAVTANWRRAWQSVFKVPHAAAGVEVALTRATRECSGPHAVPHSGDSKQVAAAARPVPHGIPS